PATRRSLSKPSPRLSITHISGESDLESDFDVCEPRKASPYDHVSGRMIARPREASSEPSQLYRIERERSRSASSASDVADKAVQQLRLGRGQGHGWRGIRSGAVHHRQPKYAPAEDAKDRYQIGQPVGGAELGVFPATS